ncbi:phosphate signaling complex protein PhoU [Verminephrobacter eiseniae]|uniref:phosphate signaling complex protein PhoU n=1 Tax=Verminephrobacter eiseniae TaxID=364317 RepID=UPI002238170A|nr:phosphate signaling complex protein PhoU [Verminephrobacter eiseniae]MCW5230806.1 phosphate transport system regulatory protein PhoU [Verminephrobacter eiseniae]MCW5292539.1 phosphate transport system regulatory protein PhoU [Verminephrobacter eiseniae]MCW8187096.1 phosphate transport system regulatory protein PhoU [Verminephrobacter eiseniae]MCW8223513.1 phosphate transport system regulatory protein PhoU [Verminephrobacter eiseniae]MCW8233730.1 phosphate transport system regulatory protein
MPQTHIVTAFDQELDRLTSSIGAMGDFAGAQVTDAVRALLHGDTALARRVVDQDRQLDALRRDLSASAALVIAKRQPLAGDLDEVLADFKIVEDLERIGDLAKNIAKRAIAISGMTFPDVLVTSLDELSNLAVDQLRRALATFVARDAAEAMVVRQQDEATDAMHTAIFRDLVSRMGADPSQIIGFVHLLFCELRKRAR